MECARGCAATGSLRPAWLEIARRTDASPTAAKRKYEIHRREILGGESYPERLQGLATELLARLG